MKRLLLLLLLSGASGAFAQKAVSCSQSVLFRVEDAVFYPEIVDTSVDAFIRIPASFPNPASTKEIRTPFTMKCPGFTAISKKGEFTLMGDVGKNFQRLTSYWKEGDPDTTSYVSGMVDLAFYGYFYYENIREDWNQERLALRLKNGRLNLSHEGYGIFFKDLVVGYRVNSGKLTPAYFNNKTTQMKHGPRDVVEIYAKGEHIQLSYMKIDFKNQKIIIRHGTPFPAK